MQNPFAHLLSSPLPSLCSLVLDDQSQGKGYWKQKHLFQKISVGFSEHKIICHLEDGLVIYFVILNGYRKFMDTCFLYLQCRYSFFSNFLYKNDLLVILLRLDLGTLIP